MTRDLGTSIREDVVVLLARASGAALRTANAALEPFGFRARHYATVKIAAEGGGVPQRQIGAVLGLDPSAVVALVDDLESLGLVQRQPDPDDRRTRLVSPTTAGLAMLEAVSPVVGRVQERSMGGLTATERETFLHLLRRVIND
ncbi:MAG TPA: MarR family transcriptional regulator [Dermatophilaceae bacterium]|jgi:DNA-binding MarR family transcriptional regulator|uniref:MarR family transcriptional regulator n=1 Tax=Candidatus Phosphoribacter hodrii TaxID=2953743 RepID=A0A935CGA2_9MICO|nr:MarR family transcriptional regulator [Candidatus Phosphoribacter hodrii]MBP8838379.1 MarR family transcriptional regulator [Dermatophilaceae bacterium]HOA58885.1 MarR family transcriptional regulator [Dermatophilaceae bacterium]HOF37366.1 MarR family transcriptional regulator [Dermatophilaceae bacterium]HOV02593.1 MarR family transcriptional regulator [Dermatophilaceae bacterium]